MKTIALMVITMLMMTGVVRAQIPDGIIYVTISPDGSRLAVTGTNGLLKIVDAATRQDILVIPDLTSTVHGGAWSPDGSRLAVSHWGDHTLRIYDTSDGRLIQSQRIFELISVYWSSQHWIAVMPLVMETVNEISILDGDTLETLCTHQSEYAFRGAVRPDGSRFAVAARDGAFEIHVADGCRIEPIGMAGDYRAGGVSAVGYSADGNLLAIGREGGQVEIWNVQTRLPEQTFSPHTERISAIAWSADGRYLASAAQDAEETIRIVDLTTGAIVSRYRLLQTGRIATVQIAFSPDGAYLYYGDGVTVYQVSVGPDASS